MTKEEIKEIALGAIDARIKELENGLRELHMRIAELDKLRHVVEERIEASADSLG